jgi:chemotaxis protein MotA
MDRATLTGLALGLVALIGGHYLEGGSAGMIIQVAAMVIVFGGTLGAVCLSFNGAQLLQAVKVLPSVLRQPRDPAPEYLARLVELAYRARREGLLSLERELERLPDPFWRRGLRLLVDGFPPSQVREIMEVDLDRQHDHDLTPARV